ncbi:Ni/Co efflux regulator RcnB [Variovorax sp. 54]|uniref:RcnB family protein n=1 Tax=Variovorax sp. 54 TaxID=2035212 RepID=UPI000C1885DD|nr:RcnB family protein [Variovorax sp. 54]PIF75939.1 Ni/Co efflux regulator RcnB [Variovorax sp. 54]
MIFRTKRLTTAAVAALALSLAAGSALAQDRRGDDQRPGGGRYEQRDDHRGDHRGAGRYEQRNDHRGHRGPHAGYRGDQDFRDGRQFDRRGFPQPHSEWRRGGRVPTEYRGRNYVVNDWRAYRLQQPPRGYQWVGVGGDYVLAAIATGLIAQIIAGQ